jgi:hypothetical protein
MTECAQRVAERSPLDRVNLVGLWSFLTLGDLELDSLTLFEGLVTIHLDRAVVHEYVTTAIDGDEAVTLLAVEPLDRALCHNYPWFLDPPPTRLVGAAAPGGADWRGQYTSIAGCGRGLGTPKSAAKSGAASIAAGSAYSGCAGAAPPASTRCPRRPVRQPRFRGHAPAR